MPQAAPVLLAKPDSVIAKRGAFATKNLWVTPHADEVHPPPQPPDRQQWLSGYASLMRRSAGPHVLLGTPLALKNSDLYLRVSKTVMRINSGLNAGMHDFLSIAHDVGDYTLAGGDCADMPHLQPGCRSGGRPATTRCSRPAARALRSGPSATAGWDPARTRWCGTASA
jgi:hypothetical protein